MRLERPASAFQVVVFFMAADVIIDSSEEVFFVSMGFIGVIANDAEGPVGVRGQGWTGCHELNRTDWIWEMMGRGRICFMFYVRQKFSRFLSASPNFHFHPSMCDSTSSTPYPDVKSHPKKNNFALSTNWSLCASCKHPYRDHSATSSYPALDSQIQANIPCKDLLSTLVEYMGCHASDGCECNAFKSSLGASRFARDAIFDTVEKLVEKSRKRKPTEDETAFEKLRAFFVQSHEQDNAFLMKKLRYMTDAISEGTGAVINDDAVFSDDSTLRTMYAGSEAVDVVDKILGLSEKWHGWGDEWGEETEEEVEAGIREFNGGESEDEEDEDEDEDEEESDEGDEEEDDEEEEEDPDDDVILIGEKKSGEQRITLSVEGE